MNVFSSFKNLSRWLARPQTVFFTLLWLMVILVTGTIAQKYVGLYRAQHIYFFSWVIWLGFVPLPGGLPTLGFLTVSLMTKTLFFSEWTLQRAGSLLAHIGALMLLLGGLITFVHAQEGSMVLFEGETSNKVSSYHDRELVFERADDGDVLWRQPWKNLKPGEAFSLPTGGLTLEVVKLCQNCDIFPRDLPEDDPSLSDFKGMARRMDIRSAPLALEDEQNLSAIQFRVSGAGKEKDGIHFSADFIDVSPTFEVNGVTYHIALRRVQTELPFSVELVDFQREVHPGTQTPKSYRSKVVLRDGDSEWYALIQMNEPLRYRGYTFYQASFMQREGQEATVLAVVKNAGRIFPYLSSLILCLGVLVHLLLRWQGRGVSKATVLVASCVFLSMSGSAQAASDRLDVGLFSKLPILHEGRVKPIDTFARSELEIFYGGDHLPDQPASAWLLRVLFDPYAAYEKPIFRVSNPQVLDALELERRKKRYYSYRELTTAYYQHEKVWAPLLQKPESALSLPEKQMLDLLSSIRLFADISRSLSVLSPEFKVTDEKLAEELGVQPGVFLSLFDLSGKRPVLEKLSKDTLQRLVAGRAEASQRDQALASLVMQITQAEKDAPSQVFRILPPSWQDGQGLWHSPWSIGRDGEGSPDSARLLGLWQDLVRAYEAGDGARWNETLVQISQTWRTQVPTVSAGTLSLEVSFNRIDPFFISFGFYIAALLCLLAGRVIWPRVSYFVSAGCLAAGFACHTAGLAARMYIMSRPPVTNLYESIIFVSLIAVFAGLLFEWKNRQGLGLFVAASLGALLQLIGLKFNAEGDTMGMLVAVLDTNFWLSTHVVCITTGYAMCLVGGLMAHVYLLHRLFRPGDEAFRAALYKGMQTIILVALFFAALGTLLGGIWADQSWGRFWGWDPKENGALLIVLWLTALLHGRLGDLLDKTAYAAGLALTNVIVAMAWFGVNLLNVGLHSYGFTHSAAYGFAGFCVAEVLLIAAAFAAIKLKNRFKEQQA